MLFSNLAAIGVSSLMLPLLASAESLTTPAPMAGAASTHIPDFANPYRRPSFDEHLYPPPSPPTDQRSLQKRQKGSANFIVHMCRDAAQNDCDPIWVSAAQYCYDNFHWFGWNQGTFVSAKVEGTMCCSFYADAECNKPGGHKGWVAQICQNDSGDALQMKGAAVNSWMCNIPYGSANRKMSDQPPEVSAVPQGGDVQIATQYAP